MTTSTSPVAERCLYAAARLEAEAFCRRHAPLASSRMSLADGDGLGLDPDDGEDGECRRDAIAEWNRMHWWYWVCDRVLEHVRGEVFWAELDGSRFAAKRTANGEFHAITDEILGIRRRLEGELDRLGFADRRQLEERLAELVNSLLA